MTARSPEDKPSNEPIERRERGGREPSLELLDTLLERPQYWQGYLTKLTDERYPVGGRDLKNTAYERVSNKKISKDLHYYEREIGSEDFTEIIENFRTLALEDPDVSQYNDLFTPHIINQHIMSMLYRVYVSAQYPAPDTLGIKAAQIKLALESHSILTYQQSIPPEDGRYLNKQRFDIDAVIVQLGTLIPDADPQKRSVKSIEGTAIIPNPHHDPLEPLFREPEFLIFTPTESSDLYKREAATKGILPEKAVAGEAALRILEEASVREMAGSVEFEKKGVLGRLLLARRAIDDAHKKQNLREEDSE